MPERAREQPVDYPVLAEFLAALGYATRLELLDQLRVPRTLGEIRVTPVKAGGGSPDRAATRQTVLGHLAKLAQAGLVTSEQVELGGKQVPRYAVSPQRLYAITEELRRLSTIHAGRGGLGEATGTLGSPHAAEPREGPRLVLVHGVYEGKAFPLDHSLAPDGRWVIGRKRGLPVTLDYDPYVSLENAVVERAGGGFKVTDLPGSKNGTSVNWVPLPRGGTRALEPGDIVGVGRSLLGYHP